MSKYQKLWEWIGAQSEEKLLLTYAQIQEHAGIPIDHSFLTAKKELLAYGYQVGKISMKNQTVSFEKLPK